MAEAPHTHAQEFDSVTAAVLTTLACEKAPLTKMGLLPNRPV